MASFTALKTAIQNAIKQNGNEEITGDVLQQILLSIVNTMGDGAINTIEQNLSNETSTRQSADNTLQSNINAEAGARQGADTQLQNAINAIKADIDNGYVYAGIATPSSTPVSGKVFYIATDAGTYTNFGNQVLTQGINILRFNGSAWSNQQLIGIDDVPTAGSNNIVKSGSIQNELALGAVYDVSAKNPTAGPNNDGKWESLSALLSDANLNTLIPTAYRKGGMSIKFVQSSDNKYVQFRYMGTAVAGTPNPFLDTTNWQGVDDAPVAGSENLVKSGGMYDVIYGESLENLIYDGGNVAEVGSTDAILTSDSNLFNITLGDGYIQVQGQNISGNAYMWANVRFTPQYGHRYAVVYDMYQATSFKMHGTLSFFSSSDANRGNYTNEYDYFNEGANVRLYDFTDRYSAYAYAGFKGGNVTIRVRSISVFDLGEEGSPYYNLTATEIIEAYNKRSTYQQYLSLVDGLATEIDIVNEKANTNAENIANVSNTVETNLFDYSDISNDYVERIQNYKITNLGLIAYSAGWKVRVYPVVIGEQYKFDIYNTNQCIAFFDTIPSVGSTGDVIYFGSTNVIDYTARADGYIGVTYISSQYYVNTYKKGYKFAPRDVQGSIDDFSISVGSPYNNMAYNRSQLSDWYTKYLAKEVDDYNRLVVTMAGDSIFGRVDKGVSWEPSNPQIAYTPDCNDVNETDYGYQTGHFPPNMWEQIIAYKVLKLLQFEEADVKYFNHSANEVSLSGSWQNVFPLGADSIRAIKSVTANDSAEMSFSAAFLKIVYTCYEIESDGKTISIQFSDDNGVTWKSAPELGLTCNIASVGNAYTTPSIKEKFGSILFKGFDVSKTYKVKVTNTESSEFGLWGFETWNNKRVDVIVTAQGGNVARNQLNNPQRFYSEMSNASLCIYEQPYYNDLGTGIVSRYKGEAKADTVPSVFADQSFYYCKETGVYTNFGNVKAYKGDYIEYNSTSQTWQRGSRQLDYAFAYYRPNNKEVLELRSMLGIPVLAVVTHDGDFSLSRPFMCNDGMSWLRNCIALSGLPAVDVSFWNIHNKVTSGFMVDGVHLNDDGVAIYMNLLKDVLLPENQMPVRLGKKQYRHLNKTVAGTVSHVDFGFIFAKKPIVRIYGNNSITISNITKTGFDVSGSGGFEWDAFVE